MSGTTTEAVAPVTTTETVPAATETKPVETKPTEQKPAETGTTVLSKPADAEGKPAEGAPAEIKYEIKAPAGIEIDTEVVDKFIAEVAKAKGLTNEQAQAIVEFGAKHNLEYAKAQEAAMLEGIKTERDAEWAKLKAHPDYGGKNWEKTQRDASAAFVKFADEGERAFIETNMLGDRGPMITLFAKIHRALSEGSTTGAGANHADNGKIPTEEDLHRQLYPSMFKEEAEG